MIIMAVSCDMGRISGDNEEIFEGIDVGYVLGQVSSNPEADNNSPKSLSKATQTAHKHKLSFGTQRKWEHSF